MIQVKTDLNRDGTDTTPSPRWLVLAHAAWLVSAVLTAIVLLGALPVYYSQLAQPIRSNPYGLGQFNLPFQVLLGLSDLVGTFMSFALAILLFCRKPNDRMALFASFFFLFTSLAWSYSLDHFLTAYFGAPSTFAFWANLSTPPTILLFSIFPDGRFVPRWTRWVFLVSIPITLARAVTWVQANYSIPAGAEASAIGVVNYSLYMLVIYAQVYRYRRVSSYAERQQTKWWFYGLLVTLALSFVASLIYKRFSSPLLNVTPIFLTIAILRSRLWDIDIIINRTLVYGTLSAGIVVTYILLVGLFGILLHTDVSLAAAVVTLALTAFLIRPLRTRLQRGVDRVISDRHDSPKSMRGDESHGDASTQRYQRLAWAIAALSLALVVIGVTCFLFVLVKGYSKQWPAPHLFFSPVLTITFTLVGALVASHHPRNPIGWIFLAVGFLSALNLDAPAYRMLSQSVAVQSGLPGVEVAQWVDLWVWIPLTLIPFTILLLLFPHGHLPSPRWRLIAWAAALGLAGIIFGVAFDPRPNVDPNPVINPFGIAGAAAEMEMLQNVASILLAAGILGSVGALVVRVRRSRGIEREQIKWLVYAVILGIVIMVVAGILFFIWPNDSNSRELSIVSVGIALCCIVIAAGIAILRYHLYDIDLIINRALVYGLLTAGIVALYVLLVGAFSALSQTSGNLWISLLATGLIAFLFQPLRERLQRDVNRLLYGERDEPYAVITRLGHHLETAIAPDSMLGILVGTIAQALKLPYVAIETDRNGKAEIAAEHGQSSSQLQRIPLPYQGETVGQLLVAPRGPNEPLSPPDLNLLRIIAQQAGMAVHAVQLTEDLQRSREHLVVAREEERRRIRRNLHDGLGPALASLAMQADNAREWTQSDPSKTEAALADITAKAQDALQDIRRLVYDLRPPALDELGLVGALRQTASNSANGLHIEIDTPESLPPLSAAVEVAAYRIAQETLNNVMRHSHARKCTLRIFVQDELQLEIRDDGVGLPHDVRAGVGLVSMRERAAELGGSCLIEPIPGGGTRVLARLPLAHQHNENG